MLRSYDITARWIQNPVNFSSTLFIVVVVACTIDFLRAGVDVSLPAAFDSSTRRHRL